MSDEFQLDEVAPKAALEIAAHVPLWKIPRVLGAGFSRLKNHIEDAGSRVAGAPYCRYLDIDWDSVRDDGALAKLWQLFTRKMRMQVGMPSADPVDPASDMAQTELAPGRCVKAIHRGPYHKVDETYKRIANWAVENRVSLANSSIECYVNDPAEVAPEDIETEILISVKD